MAIDFRMLMVFSVERIGCNRPCFSGIWEEVQTVLHVGREMNAVVIVVPAP